MSTGNGFLKSFSIKNINKKKIPIHLPLTNITVDLRKDVGWFNLLSKGTKLTKFKSIDLVSSVNKNSVRVHFFLW